MQVFALGVDEHMIRLACYGAFVLIIGCASIAAALLSITDSTFEVKWRKKK